MSAQPDNLARFHERTADLTLDQARDATHHLLGGISDYVDPEEWDAAVERAVKFVLGSAT